MAIKNPPPYRWLKDDRGWGIFLGFIDSIVFFKDWKSL
jgi:hypothetical protein